MPVSVTLTCSLVLPSARESSRTSTSTWPRSVNFSALPTRLVSTCWIRVGSPMTPGGTSGSMSQISSSPFWCARSASGLSASAITVRGENGTASSSSLRDSIFEKSRMSLRIDSSVSADVRTVARPSRWSA